MKTDIFLNQQNLLSHFVASHDSVKGGLSSLQHNNFQSTIWYLTLFPINKGITCKSSNPLPVCTSSHHSRKAPKSCRYIFDHLWWPILKQWDHSLWDAAFPARADSNGHQAKQESSDSFIYKPHADTGFPSFKGSCITFNTFHLPHRFTSSSRLN